MFSICVKSVTEDFAQIQWDQVFKNFNPDNIYTIGEAWGTRPMRDAIEVTSAEELPDKPLVIITPDNGRFFKGEISLVDFEHPEDAIYLFGNDEGKLRPEDIGDRKPDHLVYIPLNKSELYSWVAAAIVMYDIGAKNGRS